MGKTVVAIGLAHALAAKGGVLILDVDLHGPDVLSRLGLDPTNIDYTLTDKIKPLSYKPNISAYSADCLAEDPVDGFLARDEDKRAFIKSAFKQLDLRGIQYIICDMPAGTDETIYVFLKKQVKMDHLILVTNPERSSVLDMEKLINILIAYNFKNRVYGIIENMAYVTGPGGEKGRRFNDACVQTELCSTYDIPFLGQIPEMVVWDGTRPDPGRIYEHPLFNKIVGRGGLV